MKGWIKWILIISVVAILTIFFGSIVFNLTAYVFDALKVFCGWISIALRFLGKIFDFFGFAGAFSVQADAPTIAHNVTQILRIGG